MVAINRMVNEISMWQQSEMVICGYGEGSRLTGGGNA